MSRNGTVERKQLSDIKVASGMSLWQLTDSEEASIHSYYDLCPWNDDGNKIVFCAYDQDRPHTNVYWMDAKDGVIHQIGATSKVDPHEGLDQQWVPGTSKVVYDGKDHDEEFIKLVDVNTSETKDYKGSMRMVHLGGKTFVTHTHHEFRTSNSHRDTEGIFLIDINSGSKKLLVFLQDVLDTHPDKDKIDHTPLYIKHTKWSPDGSKLFFVFTNEVIYKGEPRVKDIYTVNADGSGLCPVLLSARMKTRMNHPSWHPDSKRILLNRVNEHGEKKLSYLDVETGRFEDLEVSDDVTGSTHPSVSPDGKYIVIDKVKMKEDGKKYCGLYIFDILQEKLMRAVEFPVMDHSHQGTHEHPVWSRDSRNILFNSERTGHAEIYLLHIN